MTDQTSTHKLRRVLLMPLAVVGVLLVLLEEYLWDQLVAFGQWLGQREALRSTEARIRRLSPRGAAVALLTPVAFIFPVKLVAVYAIASGHFVWGLAVLLSAKLVGTALVAHIYTLCEPALLSVGWFVHLRAWVLDAKDWAHRRLDAWPLYRFVRCLLGRVRAGVKKLVRDVLALG